MGQATSKWCACSVEGEIAEPIQLKVRTKVSKKHFFTEDELRHVFGKFDANGDSVLDLQEFAGCLEDLGVHFTAVSIKRTFNFLDQDKSGGVSFDEFNHLMANKDRRLGLNRIFQAALAKDGKKKETEKAINNKDFHCFILCGKSSEAAGNAPPSWPTECPAANRPWWIASVLEFVEITCTGDHLNLPRVDPLLMVGEVDPAKVGTIDKCECAILLLNGASRCTEAVLGQLKIAEENQVLVTCVWDVEEGSAQVLEEFRAACPYAFERRACPISRHFTSDSEQVVLKAVHDMLKKETPVLGLLRPPGSDVDDFRDLVIDGVKYLEPEFAMVVKAGDSMMDIPPGGFSTPNFRRPLYVSYPREHPGTRGLTQSQCLKMRDMISQIRAGGRVVFIDNFSLEDGNLLSGIQLAEVLSLSRFIILDEVDPAAKDNRPYLARGNCFLEASVCILSGLLCPRYKMQFVDLDNAIGEEISAGLNFRKYFRDHCSSRELVVETLCSRLRSKDFDSDAECENAEKLLRLVLERHPLLQEGSEGLVW